MKEKTYNPIQLKNYPYDLVLENTRKNHSEYENATPIVIGVVRKEDDMLIVRNKKCPYWQFVTGHLEPKESAEQAIVREVLEETGVHATVKRFLRTYPCVGKCLYLFIAFELEYVSGEVGPNDDVDEAKWVHKNEMCAFREEGPSQDMLDYYIK